VRAALECAVRAHANGAARLRQAGAAGAQARAAYVFSACTGLLDACVPSGNDRSTEEFTMTLRAPPVHPPRSAASEAAMTIVQQERPAAASPYRFEREMSSGFERLATQHHELTLTTVFQPIFSLSHQRAVGYEALLRAHDPLDRAVSPLDVFGQAARQGELLQLDRLAQALHLENFALLGAEREWLFLNVHPGVLTDPFQAAALLANLKRLGMPPRRVVLEVLEQRAEDVEQLADAVREFRAQGFLIALDDFGAGHSNIERIWQLNPDIVKLDRIMLSHAASHGAHRDPARARHAVARGRQAGARRGSRPSTTRWRCARPISSGLLLRPPGARLARQRGGDRLHRRADRALPAAIRSARAARCAAARAVPARVRTQRPSGSRLKRSTRCAGTFSRSTTLRCFLLDARGRQSGRNRARGPRSPSAVLAAGRRAGRELAAPAVFPHRRDQRAGSLTRPYLSIGTGAAVRDLVGGPCASAMRCACCAAISTGATTRPTRVGPAANESFQTRATVFANGP
jgi:EAL domain-containing protein (putative c-di-GMP-specific phosphodiesterase class I)